jgi:hypothetical protein
MHTFVGSRLDELDGLALLWPRDLVYLRGLVDGRVGLAFYGSLR